MPIAYFNGPVGMAMGGAGGRPGGSKLNRAFGLLLIPGDVISISIRSPFFSPTMTLAGLPAEVTSFGAKSTFTVPSDSLPDYFPKS